ncbi:MAG: hypothetical protein KL787_01515 [Taibaiella sp.]|nr:hypothetical protein [Taibaiella sp.]
MEENTKTVTPKEIILTVKDWLGFIIKKWVLISILVVLGLIGGYIYAISASKMFIGETNLVFQTNTGGGDVSTISIPQLSSSGNANLFQGLNLLWLYKSKGMIRKALLSSVEINDNSKKPLIQMFLEVDPVIQEKIKKMQERGVSIPTYMSLNAADTSHLTRDHEQILNMAVSIIKEEYYEAKLQEATEGVINLKFSHFNELFALLFLNNLVQSVNSYYIETKTGYLKDQITVLEQSIRDAETSMSINIFESAEAIEQIPYPNPNLQTIKVSPQKKAVDADVSSRLYVQLRQQLESAKLTLAKETPVLQVIDRPILPLPLDKKDPVVFSLLGAVLGGFIIVLILTILKIYKDIIN